MKTSTIKLPATTAEKERKALHDNVAAMYRELKEKYPEASANRLMVTVSKEKGLTVQGVRGMLIKNGVYQPKAKEAAL